MEQIDLSKKVFSYSNVEFNAFEQYIRLGTKYIDAKNYSKTKRLQDNAWRALRMLYAILVVQQLNNYTFPRWKRGTNGTVKFWIRKNNLSNNLSFYYKQFPEIFPFSSTRKKKWELTQLNIVQYLSDVRELCKKFNLKLEINSEYKNKNKNHIVMWYCLKNTKFDKQKREIMKLKMLKYF